MKLKIKTAIFSFVILLEIVACKTSISMDNEDIVNVDTISQKKLSGLFEYTLKYNDTYFVQNGNKKELGSFRPIIYTYVKPLKEDKNSPQKIYAVDKMVYKTSLDYFRNELKGKSVSYIKRNQKIIFRHYFQDNDTKVRNSFPKNNKDIINYLDKGGIKYNVLKSRDNNVLYLEINSQFFRIVSTPKFCESYSCTDLKDSINIENYRNIIASTFRW